MSEKGQDEVWVCSECAEKRGIPLDTTHRSERTGRLVVRWLTCPYCEQETECHRADVIAEKPDVIRL